MISAHFRVRYENGVVDEVRSEFLDLDAASGKEDLESLVLREFLRTFVHGSKFQIDEVEVLRAVDYGDGVMFKIRDEPRMNWRDRRAEGCTAALALAHRLLPRAIRDDALDEWTDELKSAAAAGAPVVRPTISILLRALPVMCIRARLPRRVSRGRGGS